VNEMNEVASIRNNRCDPQKFNSSIMLTWKTEWQTRLMVYVLVGTSLVDVAFTFLLISRLGVLGEVNLVIRRLFELNMAPLWACIAIPLSFVCGAVLGSGCILLTSRARKVSAILFSTAIAVRMAMNFYEAILYYGLEQLDILLLPISLIAFVLTWNILSRTKSYQDAGPLQIFTTKSSGHRRRRLTAAILVAALVLVPLATLTFLQILMNISGVENLPRWLRSLGVVTELQGKLFLVGLIAIVVMILGMVYAVTTLFEILGQREKQIGPQANIYSEYMLGNCDCDSGPTISRKFHPHNSYTHSLVLRFLIYLRDFG